MTLLAFAELLERAAAEQPEAEKRGLDEAGKVVEEAAKSYIGHPQSAVGPYPAWAPLSEATEYGFWHPVAMFHVPGKVSDLGYPPNTPLLREGDLRESIKHRVVGHSVHVGSDDPVALWQELGTPGALYPIPPRSFLGRAMFADGHKAAAAVVAGVFEPLIGPSMASYLTRRLARA